VSCELGELWDYVGWVFVPRGTMFWGAGLRAGYLFDSWALAGILDGFFGGPF
jgi:hypothetical protein